MGSSWSKLSVCGFIWEEDLGGSTSKVVGLHLGLSFKVQGGIVIQKKKSFLWLFVVVQGPSSSRTTSSSSRTATPRKRSG
uniref:Uncharacterized protein n=1 Tax=Oryza glaberrima TaxID=4538 RepID=I1Q044_ORYGL